METVVVTHDGSVLSLTWGRAVLYSKYSVLNVGLHPIHIHMINNKENHVPRNAGQVLKEYTMKIPPLRVAMDWYVKQQEKSTNVHSPQEAPVENGLRFP